VRSSAFLVFISVWLCLNLCGKKQGGSGAAPDHVHQLAHWWSGARSSDKTVTKQQSGEAAKQQSGEAAPAL
jgi:hypothetical protein